MDKDKKGHDNALALVRSVTVTASATITPDQELVDVATTEAGGNVALTLPNVAEATRNVDYMVRLISLFDAETVTVTSGVNAWCALEDVLTAVGDYAVYRCDGRTWYHVDSKLTVAE
jgi:hypothetical protein